MVAEHGAIPINLACPNPDPDHADGTRTASATGFAVVGGAGPGVISRRWG